MKTLLLIPLLFVLCSVTIAQDLQEKKHRYLGFGITTNLFRSNELNNFDIPGNRFYINLDPLKYARVDFQFSSTSSTRTQAISDYDYTTGQYIEYNYELTDFSRVWAVGVFAQYPFEEMNVYFGIRYGKNKYQDEKIGYGGPNNLKATDDGTKRYFEPTIGGEYRFGNRFSVGGEFRILFLEDRFMAEGASTAEISTMNVTESSVFFRFYPF